MTFSSFKAHQNFSSFKAYQGLELQRLRGCRDALPLVYEKYVASRRRKREESVVFDEHVHIICCEVNMFRKRVQLPRIIVVN